MPSRASTHGSRRFQVPPRHAGPRCRTSSARPTSSSALQPRSIVPHLRSTRPRSILRSQKSLRARMNSIASSPGRRRRAARRRSHRPPRRPPLTLRRPRRQVRIFLRSSAISSRSRARSRHCSVPITSSNRSPLSAVSSPKSVTPSPRRCLAGRLNRSRTRSARWRAASTTPARAESTARRSPASNARWVKFAKYCAR